MPALHRAGRIIRRTIKTTLENPHPPTHANVVDPIEAAINEIDRISGIFNFYSECINAKKLKKISPAFLKYENGLRKAIYSDRLLYQRISSIDTSTLSEEFQEQTKKHLHCFDENGVFLDPATLSRLKKIENKINRLSLHCMNNAVTKDGKALYQANARMVIDILKLRRQRANILGYETYVDLMAKNETLKTRQEIADHLMEYHKSLIALKETSKGLPYFGEAELEYLKNYFPLDHVYDGVMRCAERFFNVRFVRTERKFPVHHDPFPIYEVHDNETGKIIGLVGADLYCHEGESKNGTVAYGLRHRYIDQDEKTHIPIAILCFEHSYPEEGQQILIEPSEAITIAHEFGHIMHAIKGTSTRQTVASFNVNTDISETPSEFMELLLWDRDNMRLISKHHEIGCPLTHEQADYVISGLLRNFIDERLQHCFVAILDHAMHTHDPEKITDLLQFENEILEGIGLKKTTEALVTATSLWHIISSASAYSGRQYSYTYSDMIAADLYKEYLRHKAEGPEADEKFRKNLANTLYAMGATKPAETVIRLALGRESDTNAFKDLTTDLIRKGLTCNLARQNLPTAPVPPPSPN